MNEKCECEKLKAQIKNLTDYIHDAAEAFWWFYELLGINQGEWLFNLKPCARAEFFNSFCFAERDLQFLMGVKK